MQVLSLQAGEAAAAGKTELQRSLDEKALTMIREERKRHPSSLVFLQAECDLAARGGDYNRAVAITEEIDKLSPASTTGPLLRARLLRPSGQDRARWPGLTARPWNETPRQPDVRVSAGPGADQAARHR